MASKVLRFGGEGLPAGSHTFYIRKDGADVRAEVGHEVEPDAIVNPQEFIDRKMAALVNPSAKKDNPVS